MIAEQYNFNYSVNSFPVDLDGWDEDEYPLVQLRKEIRTNAGLLGRDGEKLERLHFWRGVEMVDFSGALALQEDPDISREEAKQRIFTGVEETMCNVAYVLGEIGVDSISRYQSHPEQYADYLMVAQTMGALTQALKATAEGRLRFKRDTFSQLRRLMSSDDWLSEPDYVHVFRAGPTKIDGQRFRDVEFFIRPHDYRREIDGSSGNTIVETREARTKFEVKLPFNQAAHVRIDPPHPEFGRNRLTFDVHVGKESENLIDRLRFGRLGQRGGHHFQSWRSLDLMGVSAAQIHEGIAAKLQALCE